MMMMMKKDYNYDSEDNDANYDCDCDDYNDDASYNNQRNDENIIRISSWWQNYEIMITTIPLVSLQYLLLHKL